jgi:V/A-type H+-transporting ATPase subunit A
VQLLGTDALAPPQRVVLATGRLLREDFLQQSAFDDVDAYCALIKQCHMLSVIRAAHEAFVAAVERGARPEEAASAPALWEVARMKYWPDDEVEARAEALISRLREEIEEL